MTDRPRSAPFVPVAAYILRDVEGWPEWAQEAFYTQAGKLRSDGERVEDADRRAWFEVRKRVRETQTPDARTSAPAGQTPGAGRGAAR